MVYSKYLLSLVVLFSGGANAVAFGTKFDSGGATNKGVNDKLQEKSDNFETLARGEETRLSRERRDIDSKNSRIQQGSEKNNQLRKKTEETGTQVKETQEKTTKTSSEQTKQIQEKKTQLESSYTSESKTFVEKLQSEAQQIGKKLKDSWDKNQQQITKTLKEIQASNQEKIKKLFEEIKELPNRIFKSDALKKK